MGKKALIIGIVGFYFLIPQINAQTWTAPKRLTWTSGASKNPSIDVDTNDNIHIVWNDVTPGNSELYYCKSTNEGISWMTKRLTWNSGISETPAIVTDSSNHIHLVWEDKTPGNAEIYYRKSTNGGTNWTTKRLTWNSGESEFPKIAVDSSNHIHVVWYDDMTGNYEIYHKKSTNGGTNWTTKRLTWNSGSSIVPSIAIDTSDNIQVVWQDSTPGKSEIYYKKSTNGGMNWTVKRLTWNPGSSYYPDIATDVSDHTHATWYDWTSGRDDIYYMRSTDGGVSWSTKRLTWTAGASYNPSITSDSLNNIHIVWIEEIGAYEIYYKRSSDGGMSWTTKRLTWNGYGSYDPALATDSSNRIFVVWSDHSPGNNEIFIRKGLQ